MSVWRLHRANSLCVSRPVWGPAGVGARGALERCVGARIDGAGRVVGLLARVATRACSAQGRLGLVDSNLGLGVGWGCWFDGTRT